jgi:hypothetical protein
MEMFGLSILLFTRLFSKTTELLLFQLTAERFYMKHWEFNICYFGTPGAFPRRRNDYFTNFNLSSTYSEIIRYNFTSLNICRVALKHMGNLILPCFICPVFHYLKNSSSQIWWHSQDSNYLLTYLLTPWSRVLLEKLTGSAASQEIPRIFGTRRFLTVLTSARHLSLSCANSIQSPQLPPISWRSFLILSSNLRLGLPNGLFPSGFPTSNYGAQMLFKTYSNFYHTLAKMIVSQYLKNVASPISFTN